VRRLSSSGWFMTKFTAWLVRAQMVVLIMLFASLNVSVFLQVITRYVTQSPLPWTEEASRFCFIWIVLWGASICVKRQRHFAVDLLPSTLSPRTKWIILILINLLVMAFAIVLIVHGWRFFKIGLIRMSPTGYLRMAWAYSAIPTSGIFMVIYNLEAFAQLFRGPQTIVTVKEEPLGA